MLCTTGQNVDWGRVTEAAPQAPVSESWPARQGGSLPLRNRDWQPHVDREDKTDATWRCRPPQKSESGEPRADPEAGPSPGEAAAAESSTSPRPTPLAFAARDPALVAAVVPPPVEDGLGDEVGVGRHGGVVGAVDAGFGHGLELCADVPGVLERHVLAACNLEQLSDFCDVEVPVVVGVDLLDQRDDVPDVLTCSLYRNSSRAMSPREISPVPFLSTCSQAHMIWMGSWSFSSMSIDLSLFTKSDSSIIIFPDVRSASANNLDL
eukprot:CAMPEP_0172182068 /NCGR_PEP_ID=MMETSP1050-20130122/18185_1 /TAXON_ID=233186 /ORGANISM="Cryptomonas curvata, Strain CCAP979/52" /LENGTH=264 /DNA_ID=CAMNT_0012855455 /DNA_START=151 /DNA_END=948 /DNA_ORIENTATION=+